MIFNFVYHLSHILYLVDKTCISHHIYEWKIISIVRIFLCGEPKSRKKVDFDNVAVSWLCAHCAFFCDAWSRALTLQAGWSRALTLEGGASHCAHHHCHFVTLGARHPHKHVHHLHPHLHCHNRLQHAIPTSKHVHHHFHNCCHLNLHCHYLAFEAGDPDHAQQHPHHETPNDEEEELERVELVPPAHVVEVQGGPQLAELLQLCHQLTHGHLQVDKYILYKFQNVLVSNFF